VQKLERTHNTHHPGLVRNNASKYFCEISFKCSSRGRCRSVSDFRKNGTLHDTRRRDMFGAERMCCMEAFDDAKISRMPPNAHGKLFGVIMYLRGSCFYCAVVDHVRCVASILFIHLPLDSLLDVKYLSEAFNFFEASGLKQWLLFTMQFAGDLSAWYTI